MGEDKYNKLDRSTLHDKFVNTYKATGDETAA